MRISLGYLFPEIMSTYGDRGNVETIIRRCGWRGIDVDVTELRLGDRIEPDAVDLIVIGGGGESQQLLVAPDLSRVKGPAIREAVAQGAAALAVGGGYELFGRFCQPEQGAEMRGVELFDAWTIRQNRVLSGHYASIAAARDDRAIGELVVRWRGTLLVGFENHGGGTYLGPSARPLGEVLSGHGNNGDGTDGVILGNAVGTYLRGPCLPRNPALADFLIAAALTRRYGTAELAPLADDLELAAHAVAMQRALAARSARGRIRRAAFSRAAQSRAAFSRAGLTRLGFTPAWLAQSRRAAAGKPGLSRPETGQREGAAAGQPPAPSPVSTPVPVPPVPDLREDLPPGEPPADQPRVAARTRPGAGR
jgi:lipid II isoglutaminyl synthase (glutamine-hydrolysing)